MTHDPQPALRNATSSNIAAVGGQRPTAAIFELVAFLRAGCDMTIINKGTRYYKDDALSRGPCLVWPCDKVNKDGLLISSLYHTLKQRC